MPRITFIRVWEETEPAWDRGHVPWIVRVTTRWGVTMVGFLVAEFAVNELYNEDKWIIEDAWALMLAAAVFVLIRVIVRPFLLFLTCPLQMLTLGLFIFVINAFIVLITEWWSEIFDIGFQVNGFIPAFIGALFISAVSFIIDRFLRFNPIGPNSTRPHPVNWCPRDGGAGCPPTPSRLFEGQALRLGGLALELPGNGCLALWAQSFR